MTRKTAQHTSIYILSATMLLTILSACGDKADPKANTATEMATPATAPAQTTIASTPQTEEKIVIENATPDWVELNTEKRPNTPIVQAPQTKASTLYINRNSVEKNPGNPNWRNAIVMENLEPSSKNQNTPSKIQSTIMRYTVDCAHNLLLPIDHYGFSATNATGDLIASGPSPLGAIKLDDNADPIHIAIKTQVCALPASDPLAMLPSTAPDWELIHRPQPPQADTTYTYIDKSSIRTSIEHPGWKRASVLVQESAIQSANQSTQPTEPSTNTLGSQISQISIDCTTQQIRFDIAILMEKTQAQGQRGRVALSDASFQDPPNKQAQKLIQTVCK